MSGGGKGAKSAKAPDYSALAQQQAMLNQQTAQQLTAANRPNQVDAFGNSITWSQSLSPEQQAKQKQYQDLVDYANRELKKYPNSSFNKNVLKENQEKLNNLKAEATWTQQQTLNPETKAAWDTYMRNASQATSKYGDILNNYLGNYKQQDPYGDFSYGDFSSEAQDLKAYNDPEFEGKAVADALYGSVMDRGRKEQARESDALTTQLRNTGLVPGSEAYNRAMQNLLTSQNDANLLAGQNAVLAGANEGRAKYASYLTGQGQQYGQDLTSYGTNRGNALENYNTNLNTRLTNRNQPLQELAGMAGIAGGQPYTPTYPGFSGATGYNPADLVGAAQAQYGAAQNKANASNSKKGGLLGAGASLGGSFLGSK